MSVSVEDNAKKVYKLLRKRDAKSAAELGQALGYKDGRGVSRPLAVLITRGQAIYGDGGYLKAA